MQKAGVEEGERCQALAFNSLFEMQLYVSCPQKRLQDDFQFSI